MMSMDFWEIQKKAQMAECGDGKACYEVAECFYELKDYKQAITWYQKALTCGYLNPNIYFNLAYAYQYGEGVELDLFQAFAYYEKGAEQNHAQAILNLSYFYDAGVVVNRDRQKAEELCRKATRILQQQQEEFYHLSKQNTKLLEEQKTLQQEKESLRQENIVLEKKKDALEKDISLLQRYYHKAMMQLEDMKKTDARYRQSVSAREKELLWKIEEQNREIDYWKYSFRN